MDLYGNNFAYPLNNQYTFQHYPQSSSENINSSLDFVLNQRQGDQSFLSQWDIKLKQRSRKSERNLYKGNKISEAVEQLKNLLGMIDNLKEFEVFLRDKFNTLTEQEWSESKVFVENEKKTINTILTNYTNNIGDLKKLIMKRNSKRCRIHRRNLSDKKKYSNMLVERAKKSQAIDERLQKIKDDIEKVKEEENSTRISNITLKEVLSKKADAKKNIALLESLVALRKARLNTAKGRGENESQSDTLLFTEKIGKLIINWKEAFETYSAEVKVLRATLDEALRSKLIGQAQNRKQNADRGVNAWREAMFGRADAMPQRDFQHNLDQFIAVRSRWDQFLNIDGSALPSGWLLPAELI